MSTKNLALRTATNRTVKGPLFRKDGEGITVEYDCEDDDGSTRWSRVEFAEILDFEYRQASCCDAQDILGPKEMLCLDSSDRLTALLTRWQDSVGWQERNAKQGGSERFKHFKLFFDDVGCVDVVAGSVRIPD